jgi:hypothetical protein
MLSIFICPLLSTSARGLSGITGPVHFPGATVNNSAYSFPVGVDNY